MKTKQLFYTACAAVCLSSCHIYKAYERPEQLETDGLFRDPETGGVLLSADTTTMANLPWQELFCDPKLQALIDEGLANNVDMRAATLRVEEAKVLLTSARLSFLPSINLAPQGTITKLGESGYIKAYSTPAVASWQVDLFGKQLNVARSQQASYAQSQYAEQAVRSGLVCGIANAYYTLLMLDRQVQITTETVAIYKENVRAMTVMKEAGMANEAAISQMKAAYNQVQSSLISLKSQVTEVENALAVLLARTPQKIDRGTLDGQVMPTELAAGVPLQLLENRPDVKIAEMNLAKAYYTTNQARSAFYPAVTLSATGGWTNGSGISVANPGQFLFQALASLAQPIFNNGKLIANLKVSKAEEEIAKMNYQQTLLAAGEEVSNALHQYETYGQRLSHDREQVDELSKAVDYTKALFQSGSASYLEILSAQQGLLSAQLTAVADQVQQIQAVISLYSAVGGGKN